jgi:hypothetical protein
MDIRTTAPYLESCLSHLLAEGDLAIWSSHEGHLQLRDSVGISPTSLPRGDYDLTSHEREFGKNVNAQELTYRHAWCLHLTRDATSLDLLNFVIDQVSHCPEIIVRGRALD